jgi:tRNA(Ile)-lysidine synthetase-like protein
MKLELSEGLYVLAVSGGVDSVVLFDLFVRTYGSDASRRAVVAHVDHGMREDSAEDERFVHALAKKHGLHYECEAAQLGPNASEEEARDARYAFLRSVQKKHNATAILTAHHQDDLLETILLNCARGTGRQGLTPMKNTVDIARPLLCYTKNDVLQYADVRQLVWREDSTNLSQKYTRNRLRTFVRAMHAEKRQALVDTYSRMLALNTEADVLVDELTTYVMCDGKTIKRSRFVQLEHAVACEVVSHLLARMGIRVDRRTVARVVVAIKSARVGARVDVNSGYYVLSAKNEVKILQK